MDRLATELDTKLEESGLKGPSEKPPASGPGRGQPLLSFGDFELLEEVGHGGMGVVYRARQKSLNRIVAIKMLLGGRFAGTAALARFRSEAEMAAQLQHPNIVGIHEVGELDGQPFFAMDYVEGRDLGDLVRGQPLPPATAARYVRALALAVHYAHTQGVVHRDLKPSNVILDAFDEPRITDFGLAKRLEGGQELTVSGQPLGSPSYSPPEQAEGARTGVGPWSDIYSLGAILYHLVTGRPPFVGDSASATLRLVLEQTPIAPRLLSPSLPRDLETICLQCLEKTPARRYRSGEALAQELGRFLRHEPIHARPVGWVGKSWRWCRRKPVVAGLTAGLLATLVAALAVSASAAWRVARARQDEGRENYYSKLVLAKDKIEEGSIDQALEILRECPEQYRHWEWGHLMFLCNQDAISIRALSAFSDVFRGGFAHLAFAPSGRVLASVDGEGVAKAFDLESEHEILATAVADGRALCAVFNGDGARLAVGFDNGRVRCWSTDTWQPALELESPQQPAERLAWSPSEHEASSPAARGWLAVAYSDGAVRLHDATTGRIDREIHPHRGGIAELWFTPGGDRLVTQYADRVVIVEPDTGQTLIQFAPELPPPVRAFIDQRGERFATIDGGGQLALWTNELAPISLGLVRGAQTRLLQRAFFSPDGRWLCSSGDFGSARVWTTDPAREAFVVPDRVVEARFSADSASMLTLGSDNRIRVWDLESGIQVRQLKGHAGMVDRAVFSPDGRLIASGGRDGWVKVWVAGLGRDLLRESVWMWGTSVSPDGRLIAGQPSYLGLMLWEAASGRKLLTIRTLGESVYTTAFSPEGDTLAAAGVQRVLRLYDVATGRRIRSFLGHSNSIMSIAFRPDIAQVVTGGLDGTARLWDVNTGAELRCWSADEEAVHSVDISGDGQRLLTAGKDGTAKIWDLRSGALATTLEGHDAWIWQGRFFHRSERVVTWGMDYVARIWDAETGRELRRWSTRGMSLGIVSDDDERLFTFSSRQPVYGADFPTLEVWDPDWGYQMMGLGAHRDPLLGIVYHAPSRRLVTGALDGTIRIWEAFPWHDSAYDQNPRNASESESSDTFVRQVRSFARAYWRDRLRPEAQAGGQVVVPGRVVTEAIEPELISARDGTAGPGQIDLSAFYTSPFTLPFQPEYGLVAENYLTRLPVGLLKLEGMTFDARGVIQLRTGDSAAGMFSAVWAHWPDRVEGIPVGRKFSHIHLLHGTTWQAPDHLEIAALTLHYPDGERAVLPIRYGDDVRDWKFRVNDQQGTPDTLENVVWTDTNPGVAANGRALRLYLGTLSNPRPEETVAEISYVSRFTGSAPFLVAMTVD